MTTTAYLNSYTGLIDGFLGAFPCDRIPTVGSKIKKYSIIVNLDTSQEPGSHWIAILVKNKSVYYYDPLGLKHDNRYINIFMNRFTNQYYNRQQIQPKLSEYCGLYCLAIIIHTNGDNSSINSFNSMFCITIPMIQYNDNIVVEYIISKLP